MSNKKNGNDSFFGDFMVPIIDLMSILIVELIKLLTFLINWLLDRYVFNRRSGQEIKKIERKDLHSTKMTREDTALGYSVSKRRILRLKELDRRRHTLICGAAGFGKSVLLDVLMYDDMRNGKPVIFLDPKGDRKSLEQFINLCRLSNREFQVFSEHYEGPGSISLNPAKEGSATHITDRIHYAFDWSEEHYENLCYRALRKACSLLISREATISYSSLFENLLTLSDPKNNEKLFDRRDIQGLLTRLENIVESDFNTKLEAEGLSLGEVWKSRKCIYIGLPVLGYPKIARSLGKIILGDLAYAVYDTYKTMTLISEKELRPVGVYIDELSAVITDEFIELLNKCRGAKMELTFAFQSPSDINKISPSLCEQIMENSSNWFVLKQRIEPGANTFAEAIGTIEGKKETVRVQDGEVKNFGSRRYVEELVAHHNILKNLNQGQAVLLRHSPSQVDLINIKYIDPEIAHENIIFHEDMGFIPKVKSTSIHKNKQEKIL